MSLFFSSLPVWLGALLLVILPTGLAMCGPYLMRQRFGLERLTTNNEIAGFKFATVGVIYAVLLAFAVIIVWERFADAETAVVEEAGAAATVYRLTQGDDPHARATRAALSEYLKRAIENDWPRMAQDKASPEVTRALDALYASALSMAASGEQQSPVMVELFHQLDEITQARRARLHLAVGIVPGVLWGVLILGGVLTVAFTFFFGTRNLRAQSLMTGILALIVFMGLFVIVTINHPFTGAVHIGAEALEHVLADLGASPP